MRWLFGFILLGPEYNHKGTCKEKRRMHIRVNDLKMGPTVSSYTVCLAR